MSIKRCLSGIIVTLLSLMTIVSIVFGGDEIAPVVTPLLPGVGSIFTSNPEDCGLLEDAVITDTTDENGPVRTITVSSGQDFNAQLKIRDNIQEFSSSDITAVIFTQDLTSDRGEELIGRSYRIEATKSQQLSTFELQGEINKRDIGIIKVFVNGTQIISFSTLEGPKEILAKLTLVRLALSKTVFPSTLFAMNLFNGRAPISEGTLPMSVLSAVGGLPPILPSSNQGDISTHRKIIEPPAKDGRPRPEPGLLGRWQQCLENACSECGACWNETRTLSGCHRCPLIGVLDAIPQFICWEIDAIGCVPDSLIGALR